MNKEHRNILREQRSNLVDAIGDIKKVVDRLYEKKTITRDMMENILETNHTSTDKKRGLLDLIPRRGPKAFDEFAQVLTDCEEWDAVEFLKPGQGRAAEQAHKMSYHTSHNMTPVQPAVIASPVEDDLPRFWPDENYSPMGVKVKMVAEDDHVMRNKFSRCGLTDSQFYCLQKAKRGLTVIINNEDFTDARMKKGLSLDDRQGTSMDATSLDLLFSGLHFTVITYTNLTGERIRTVLTNESQKDHRNLDCFVCCVLSHGTGGGVYGTDGELVMTQDITDLFNSQNCQTLAGKPKLFFVQACQGTKADTGSAGVTSVVQPGVSVPDDDISLKKAKQEQEEVLEKLGKLNLETQSDAHSEENVPTRADTFIAFATTPDYLSYRNTRRGTWFIQAITFIFQNYACCEDLLTMMTKVNLLVSRGEIASKGHKQVSNFNSSFRKTFFFFPGLFIPESAQSQQFNQIQPSS